MNDPWSHLIPILMSGLPDSIDQRLTTLEAMRAVLPANHPQRDQVNRAARSLHEHIVQQREFVLPPAAPAERGSSRLSETSIRKTR